MEKNKNTLLTDNQNPKGSEEGKKKKGDVSKTFTQEQVDELVGKFRKESREEMETKMQEIQKDFSKRLEQEKKEVERLAKLDTEERKAEMDKQKELELKERDLEITVRENKIKAQEKLDELEIPIKLVDFVVDVDLEKQTQKIDILKEAYEKSIEEGVQKKLEGSDDHEDPANKPPEKKSENTNPFGVF